MFKNNLIITLRNLKKYRGYSIINISGLAVGMACFILISLYIRSELSYDNFHENGDRIYRIIQRQPGNIYIGSDYFAVTPGIFAPALTADFPEIETAARINDVSRGLIKKGNKSFYENGIYTDGNFFDVFSLEIVKGTGKAALNDPYSIILSEKLAAKYFGEENPIGENISFNEADEFVIRAVFKDVPANSHLKFDYIVSWKIMETDPNTLRQINRWSSSSYYTYVVLSPNTDIQNLTTKLNMYYKRKSEKPDSKNVWIFQALSDIHLKSDFNFDIAERTDINHLYLFMGIGVLILAIACINYMNLATSRSSKRSKEIGVRKVIGANRINLIKQFIGESLSLSLLSLLAALILVILLLPLFNFYTGKELDFNPAGNYSFLIYLVVLTLFIGVTAGSYPAVFLSSFRPSEVLKSSGSKTSGGAVFRNILVVFQFSAAVLLIAGTLTINKQLKFLKSRDLGFDKDNVLVVGLYDRNLRNSLQIVKNELLKDPNIKNVSFSKCLPSNINSKNKMKVENNEGEMIDISIYTGAVDYNFINLYGLEIIEGRNFSQDFKTDPNHAIIVNEELVKRMGWKKPLRKKVTFWGAKDGEVIGIVKDFHFYSLHEKIEPAVFYLDLKYSSYASIKFDPKNYTSVLAHVKNVIEKNSLYHPFTYFYLDENYFKNYQSEKKLGEIFIYFSLISIFIACLGLFGLSAFITERRTREIGIRKTLGADVTNIFELLLKEFTGYIFYALLIGLPAAYYFCQKWLLNFAYHTSFDFLIILVTGLFLILTAFFTISYHTIKTAYINPIEVIKYE